ncbi:TIR domain protein [Helicobacter pylori]|uniref:hypothetical protein n=1 Tax=Helicobacter pylori TaxID=210 RepID=UPI000680BF72|nr:hypothetical protein [Helicobacter pylori]KNE05940.1 TIR domain protein [Helicobacter pylori]
MKAFKVDLDSKENQRILKPSVRPSNNQVHQVNEAAKKINKLIKNAPYSNDGIILNHNKIKEAFFSPFKPQLKSAQVFLSHSHADKNKALEVKNYMIKKYPYFVFLESNNSVFNQGLSQITHSAWIYEELKIVNTFIADSTLQELRIKAMRVSHNITNLLRRFKLISLDSLSNLS